MNTKPKRDFFCRPEQGSFIAKNILLTCLGLFCNMYVIILYHLVFRIVLLCVRPTWLKSATAPA